MNTKYFNEIVDQYSDNVYGYLLKNLREAEASKDIVQESFARLWKNKDSIDEKKAKSYLFTTAYHLLVDYTRKRKREKIIEVSDERNHFHTDSYSDLSEILNEALDKLPEKYKQLVLLRDYEGYSYKEIGEICKLSESQVKVYIFRSRKMLKEYLGKIENLI
ncbi:MAG: RNA polymerase sigma factor [Bacteroidota bacterium]|nr:RNA polymerase sigma factor [Bacteroidota bacterium]